MLKRLLNFEESAISLSADFRCELELDELLVVDVVMLDFTQLIHNSQFQQTSPNPFFIQTLEFIDEFLLDMMSTSLAKIEYLLELSLPLSVLKVI